MLKTRFTIPLVVPIIICLTRLTTAPVAADITDIDDKITELRKDAEFDSALVLAHRLVAECLGDSTAARHEVEDARRLVQTLERIVEMPIDTWRELALAESLEDSIDALWDGGRYYEGALLAARKLEVQRRVLGTRSPDVSSTLNYLGTLHRRSGDMGAAEDSFRETLDIDLAVLGDDHPDIAIDLGNLAAVLGELGDYAAAEELFRDALRRNREQYGDDDPEVAITLNNYASMLKKRGHLTAAEPLLREALRIRREKLGAGSWGVANVLNNLAGLFDLQGDPARAEPLFQEALEIYRARDPDHHNVGIALNNLGLLQRKRGNAVGAEALYREALAVYERSVGEEHRLHANCLNNLAMALGSRGDVAGAEIYHRRALASRRANYGPIHQVVAKSLNNLAYNLLRQRRLEESEALFRDAIDMKRRALGSSDVNLLKSLVGLSRVHLERGQHDRARERLTEAAGLFENARLRAGTGLARVTFQDSPYPLLAVTLLANSESNSAWEAAERDRARALSELLAARRARNLTREQKLEQVNLGKQLSVLEGRVELYARLVTTDTSATTRRSLDRARKALSAAQKSWSNFLLETGRRLASTHEARPRVADLQRALGDDDAVIGWLDVEINVGRRVSWVWVVRDDGPVHWTQIQGEADEVSHRPQLFLDALTQPGGLHLGVGQYARQLWRERIQPAMAVLDGARHVAVIPSGPMLGIPVEALADERGVLAAERWRVTYAPSGMILAAQTPSDERGTKDASSLVIGAPLFGDRSDYAPLPAAGDEVRAVAALVPNPIVMAGATASERNVDSLVTSGAINDFAVVHIATHATVDDQRPGRSAIVLSQIGLPDQLQAAATGGRIYDGLVTSDEIAREWILSADVVTLSACETALGRKVAGEGYVGLARAFLGAGARSVIVSLWKVDDSATALLMQRLYENLYDSNGGASASVADALDDAKRWLRGYTNPSGATPYAHPFYWSSFILVGS